MVFKNSQIPKLPNIYSYSENVKKRDLFKLDKELLKLNSKNNASKILEKSTYFQNNDGFSWEETHMNDNTNDFSLNFLDLPQKPKDFPKKSKKYLDLLNEIESQAIDDYDKLKQTIRSKSTSVQRMNENPRALKLRDIKEETTEELDDFDKLLSKKSDLNEDKTFLYYDMNKVQMVLKEKIQNELLVPIMDRSRMRNKEKLRDEKLKK